MIITKAASVARENIEEFAWTGLRQFNNVGYTSAQLSSLQGLDRRDKNVKKQANQIRDCLIQAREYSDAARQVGPATKPVLLYYCAMSLAIAEILLKNDGDYSLDRARVEHNHHGLNFRISTGKGNVDDVEAAARAIRAVPSVRQSEDGSLTRFGTFELWHRGAREYPVTGTITTVQSNNRFLTGDFGIILTPIDVRMPILPSAGLDFLDCVRHLPSMGIILNRNGIEPRFVRVGCNTNSALQTIESTFIIHPCSNSLRDRFVERIRVYPTGMECYSYEPLDSGGIVRYSIPKCSYQLNTYKHVTSDWPGGSAQDTRNFMFFTEDTSLKEF